MSSDKRSMFYGASPEIFRRARKLRDNQTKAEEFLWTRLSKKQLCGLKFRRQHPVAWFIADFYCHSRKLVIKVDGGVHDRIDQKEYDTGRQTELEELGLRVVRFKNKEILEDIDLVIDKIKTLINE